MRITAQCQEWEIGLQYNVRCLSNRRGGFLLICWLTQVYLYCRLTNPSQRVNLPPFTVTIKCEMGYQILHRPTKCSGALMKVRSISTATGTAKQKHFTHSEAKMVVSPKRTELHTHADVPFSVCLSTVLCAQRSLHVCSARWELNLVLSMFVLFSQFLWFSLCQATFWSWLYLGLG